MTRLVGKDRPFFQKATNKPEVIAHRGGASQWPEETMFAFQSALDAGVDVVEMDLHRTKDGVFVMLHDDSVDRTTNGTGKISDLDYEPYVKGLNAADKWPEYVDRGFDIPTLDDVLKDLSGARLNIEIKPDDITIVPDICDRIVQHQMEENVLIASGRNDVIHEVRRVCPRIATSASVLEIAEFEALDEIFNWGYRPDTDALQWHSKVLKVQVITKEFVHKAHDLGLVVHAWTVNEEEEMFRLETLGVDGIITDNPRLLLEVLGRTG